MLYQQPSKFSEEKITTTYASGDQYRDSARKSSSYENDQRKREDQKYDIQYYRDLCEQLNKENLQLKTFQIENNQLKQKQLLIDAELQLAQQEILRLRNQNGTNQQSDKQLLKLSQDNQLLQQQNNELNKAKQTLESELRIFKQSNLTQTIEIPDVNASQYQKKIREMEEDIQVLIEDYNNSQEKLEKALKDQKIQMKAEIDNIKNQNTLLQSEITGWQQRYSKLEVVKNELITKLATYESKMQQMVQINQDLEIKEKQLKQSATIQQMNEQNQQLQMQIQNLQNQLSSQDSKRNESKLEIKKLKQIIEQQKLEIDKLQTSLKKNSKTDKLQQRIDQYQEELQEKKEKYEQEINDMKEKNEQVVNEFKTQIETLNEQIKNKETEHQQKLQEQELNYQKEIQLFIEQQGQQKPLNYEESRLRFQTQLDVNNYESQVDKLKREFRLQEQFIKEQSIQAKLWQEKFYDQQTQNEDLRFKYQELRNQFSTYLGYKTQNEYDQNKIKELEDLVEEQQNLLHNLYQKEIHYKDTIQVYIQKIEEIQYQNNDDYVAKIQELMFEIDQLKIKLQEIEAQYKSSKAECFSLQTQIELEKHKLIEKEMQLDKQINLQTYNQKKIQQLEQQVENLQREYNIICQKKNEVIKELVEVENEQDKERIRQLEQSLHNLQQEYLIVNSQYSNLQSQHTQLQFKFEQNRGTEEDKLTIRNLQEQLHNLKQQYYELNMLKQQVVKEVVKEVVEVPVESDQILIKQLRLDLQQLQGEFLVLQSQKQLIVEVPSEVDKNRVKQLELQLITLRKDYDEVCNQRSITTEKQIVEVSSKEDIQRIQTLEKQLSKLQEDYFQLKLKQDSVKNSGVINQDTIKIQKLEQELKRLREDNQQLIIIKEQTIQNQSSQDKFKIQQLEQQINELELQLRQKQVIKETIPVSKDEDLFKIQQLELQLKIKVDDNQYLDKQLNLQKKNVEELISANEKMKQENQSLRSQLYQLQSTVDEQSYKIKDINRLQDEIKQYQVTISNLESKEKLLIDSQTSINSLKLKISDQEGQIRQLQSESNLTKQNYDFKIKSMEIKYDQQIQQLQQEIQQKQNQLEQEKQLLKNTLQQITLQNEEMQREISRLSELIKQKNEEAKKINQNLLKSNSESANLKLQLEQSQQKISETLKQFKDYEIVKQKAYQFQDHCAKLEIALKQFDEEKRIENKELHEQFNNKIMEFQKILDQKDTEILSLSEVIHELQEKIGQHADIQYQYEDNTRLMIELQNQINVIKLELMRQTNLKDELQAQNNEYIATITKQETEIRILKTELERFTQSVKTVDTAKFEKGHTSQRTLVVADFNLDDSHVSNMQRPSQARVRDSQSFYNPRQSGFNPLSSSIVKQKVFTQKKNQIY